MYAELGPPTAVHYLRTARSLRGALGHAHSHCLGTATCSLNKSTRVYTGAAVRSLACPRRHACGRGLLDACLLPRPVRAGEHHILHGLPGGAQIPPPRRRSSAAAHRSTWMSSWVRQVLPELVPKAQRGAAAGRIRAVNCHLFVFQHLSCSIGIVDYMVANKLGCIGKGSAAILHQSHASGFCRLGCLRQRGIAFARVRARHLCWGRPTVAGRRVRSSFPRTPRGI